MPDVPIGRTGRHVITADARRRSAARSENQEPSWAGSSFTLGLMVDEIDALSM